MKKSNSICISGIKIPTFAGIRLKRQADVLPLKFF